MNFRTLIEQAMREAQADFERIIKEKLEALLGAAERGNVAPAKRRGRPTNASPRGAAVAPRAKAGKKTPAKRVRTPAADIAALSEKVLASLTSGAPIGRSSIAKAVGLETTSPVLGNVLAKLRNSGKVVMSGDKRSAQYQAT